MKIGLVAEGSYPYVSGGVSNWVHMLIESMPQFSFEIIAISDKERTSKDFKYILPDNVSGLTDINLHDQSYDLYKSHMNEQEERILKDWLTLKSNKDEALLLLGDKKRLGSADYFLKSEMFWSLLVESYQNDSPHSSFLDYFSMWKSMCRPIISLLQRDFPKVDLIHSVSTGYAGVIASYIKVKQNIPFTLTEHGIYAREREEEILKSNWVPNEFKKQWIQFFNNLALLAYRNAEDVITLFEKNSRFQENAGAPEEKLRVIPNGIDYEKYAAVSKIHSSSTLRIGAIVRVVPIKDIKTMIHAARYLKDDHIPFEFIIMGPIDEDEEYAAECERLISSFELEKEVHLVGKVNVIDYLPFFDVCVLSSISESQPLAVLEGMAAGIPWVTTDVGCCSELIKGRGEDFYGDAGFIVPPVNPKEMVNKLKWFYENREEGVLLGKNGQKRVKQFYQINQMITEYVSLYQERGEIHGGHRLSSSGAF